MPGAGAELFFRGEPSLALDSWVDIVRSVSSSIEEPHFIVRSVSSSIEGHTFRVESPDDDPNGTGRAHLPFSWYALQADDPLATCGGNRATIQQLERAFGFPLSLSIEFNAGCRGRYSDYILARLALAFLEKHEGFLVFGGRLAPSLEPEEWNLWYKGTAEEQARALSERFPGHPGRLVVVSIEDDPCMHAADRAFLEWWLEQPMFHFVN
jgi:hypothetical protein